MPASKQYAIVDKDSFIVDIVHAKNVVQALKVALSYIAKGDTETALFVEPLTGRLILEHVADIVKVLAESATPKAQSAAVDELREALASGRLDTIKSYMEHLDESRIQTQAGTDVRGGRHSPKRG